MSVKTEPWEATRLGGDFPRLTSLNQNLQDSRSERIFVYGGLNPGEENEIPNPYFHICDTRTMEFSNLTHSLVYCPPGDPYSSANLARKCISLPELSSPGITFLNLRGHPMVFLFGGYDASADVDGPSSNLIAIHTKHKEWYYVNFESGRIRQKQPAPRISPVLVGCENRLYIFGGFKAFGDEWNHHRSYSIIEFVEKSHKCKWVAVDVPYPKDVPVGQVFGKGVVCDKGSRILLLPGRRNCNDKIKFNHDNLFYFFPNTNKFEIADINGELPQNVHWYYACKYEPTFALESLAPPSVFLCTWTPYSRKYLSPEVWRLYLHPRNEVICLQFHKRIFDLNINFRRFYLVGDSIYLMGEGGDASDEESDDVSVGTDTGAMCDTYIRIPV